MSLPFAASKHVTSMYITIMYKAKVYNTDCPSLILIATHIIILIIVINGSLCEFLASFKWFDCDL